jgi:SAM-dependent methyltransferase
MVMASQAPSLDAEPERGAPAWWNDRYLRGDTPWDTGIVPPELEEVLAGGVSGPGWALDLGCGSGLNARYLARRGLRVIGLDLAFSPLARGRHAARAEGTSAYLCLADVTRPPLAALQAAFAVDIGCFHALPPERRAAYVEALAARLAPEAGYLLYAFEPWAEAEGGPAGIGPAEIAVFAPCFVLRWARHGFDRARPATWYFFRRS